MRIQLQNSPSGRSCCGAGAIIHDYHQAGTYETRYRAAQRRQIVAVQRVDRRGSSENYPFCTIDPNVDVVAVPDKRMDFLVCTARRSCPPWWVVDIPAW